MSGDMEEVRKQVRSLVQELRDLDPVIAAAAAESLFDLGVKGGYASAVATRNRREIGETDGVFDGFAHLISYGTDEGQGWACAALAQIAFDNSTNCISVVRTPGMLSGLRHVMEHSSKDSKAAAALAVNNISAFSEQASAIIVQADVLNINSANASSLAHLLPFLTPLQCETIEQGRKRHGPYRSWEDIERLGGNIDSNVVQALRDCERPNLVLTDEPGLLDALKVLCRAEHTDARTDAVGAVNHISRSDQARPVLVAHNMVHEALAPALQAKYDGAEELDAIVARATMAMANIIAHPTSLSARRSRSASQGRTGCGSIQDASRSRMGHASMLQAQDDPDAPMFTHSWLGNRDSKPISSHGPLRRPIHEYIAICRTEGDGCMELRQAALGILVRCLHFALEGKKWVGITWGIFSVVHALRNLSENMANKRVLTSRGLVQLLGVLLKVWNADHGPQCEAQEPAAGRNWGEMGEMQGMPPCATGQATPRAYANMPAVGARAPGPGVEASAEAAEAAASAGPSSSSADAASKQSRAVVIQARDLFVSIQILSNLAMLRKGRDCMRDGAILDALKVISNRALSHGAIDCSHYLLQDRHLALSMSQHPRLGCESKLALLDPALMRLIVEYACDSGGCVVLAGCLVQLLERDELGDDADSAGAHSEKNTGYPSPHVMISG